MNFLLINKLYKVKTILGAGLSQSYIVAVLFL